MTTGSHRHRVRRALPGLSRWRPSCSPVVAAAGVATRRTAALGFEDHRHPRSPDRGTHQHLRPDVPQHGPSHEPDGCQWTHVVRRRTRLGCRAGGDPGTSGRPVPGAAPASGPGRWSLDVGGRSGFRPGQSHSARHPGQGRGPHGRATIRLRPDEPACGPQSSPVGGRHPQRHEREGRHPQSDAHGTVPPRRGRRDPYRPAPAEHVRPVRRRDAATRRTWPVRRRRAEQGGWHVQEAGRGRRGHRRRPWLGHEVGRDFRTVPDSRVGPGCVRRGPGSAVQPHPVHRCAHGRRLGGQPAGEHSAIDHPAEPGWQATRSDRRRPTGWGQARELGDRSGCRHRQGCRKGPQRHHQRRPHRRGFARSDAVRPGAGTRRCRCQLAHPHLTEANRYEPPPETGQPLRHGGVPDAVGHRGLGRHCWRLSGRGWRA